jgi:hypothetical protein
MTRLSLQVFYLWRHELLTAPPLILWWSNLETLFGPLHRSSPFIGELRSQAIQTEYSRKNPKSSLYCERSMPITQTSKSCLCRYWKNCVIINFNIRKKNSMCRFLLFIIITFNKFAFEMNIVYTHFVIKGKVRIRLDENFLKSNLSFQRINRCKINMRKLGNFYFLCI